MILGLIHVNNPNTTHVYSNGSNVSNGSNGSNGSKQQEEHDHTAH